MKFDDRAYWRDQDERQRRFEHAREKGKSIFRVVPSGTAAALHEARPIALDPSPIMVAAPCSERGCLFPAHVLVRDQWGAQPLCRHHVNVLKLRASTEDRGHPLIMERRRGDSRHKWVGMHLSGRAPQPLVFGLRVHFEKLERLGRNLLGGDVISTAARKSNMNTQTAREFAKRAGINFRSPYQDRTTKYTAIIPPLIGGAATVYVESPEPILIAQRIRPLIAHHKILGAWTWAVSVKEHGILVSRGCKRGQLPVRGAL